jgi:hypothetical protein
VWYGYVVRRTGELFSHSTKPPLAVPHKDVLIIRRRREPRWERVVWNPEKLRFHPRPGATVDPTVNQEAMP